MHVEVVYALPAKQHRVHLELEAGSTVADALTAVARLAPFDDLDLSSVAVGIYGRLIPDDLLAREPLQPDDRVEIYRPLQRDPKEARRRRAAGSDDAETRDVT